VMITERLSAISLSSPRRFRPAAREAHAESRVPGDLPSTRGRASFATAARHTRCARTTVSTAHRSCAANYAHALPPVGNTSMTLLGTAVKRAVAPRPKLERRARQLGLRRRRVAVGVAVDSPPWARRVVASATPTRTPRHPRAGGTRLCRGPARGPKARGRGEALRQFGSGQWPLR